MAISVSSEALDPAPLLQEHRSFWRYRLLRGLVNHPPAALSVLVLLLLLFLAVAAPLVEPHDPLRQRLTDTLLPPAWMSGGSARHLLGTDQLGRDLLSRLMAGARVSMVVGFVTASATALIGTALGVAAGYRGGWLDTLLMRTVDFLLAFPFLVITIVAIAFVGPGLKQLIIILSVWGWGGYARFARGQALMLKELEYVRAAAVVGAGDLRILTRHIIPNLLSLTLVLWTFSFASLIIVEASLSFLGLGIPPPTPTWGAMLNDGRIQLFNAWWLAVFPGLAIMLVVLAANILGDRLRDILDPHFRIS